MSNIAKKRNGKSGFTLIEIIAVLVIIAILAAVAIPKFLSLIEDSQDSALQGGVAAAQSACSLVYGKLCLANGNAPTTTEILADPGVVVSGDFTIAYADNTTTIGITASKASWGANTATGTWTLP